MTSRETRLRERIDRLTDERDDAVAQLRARAAKARARVCVYCGAERARGCPFACRAHRDLVALDPFYAEQGSVAA